MMTTSRRKLFPILLGVFLSIASLAIIPSLSIVPAYAPPIGSGPRFKTDFALFTTQTDNFVNCTSNRAFLIYISVSNHNSAPQTLRVTFTDGDFVDYIVPPHTSFSISAAAGGVTGGLTDARIKVDPLGPAKTDVNPMVGWVSVWGNFVGPLSCTPTPLP